ncbi:hypothetical protein Lser_V15G33704 [Lactuca serriola]
MMLSASIDDTGSSFVLPEHICQRFTLSEIQSATHNFDEALVIGRGGFGNVYKCSSKIGSIREVAVKRLHSLSNQGAQEFEAEIKLLSKLRHANLVSLIGYCNEGNEMVLVYDFMPNGTLEDHLRKADSVLSWLQRLKICIGAGRGLDYLHTGTSTQHGVIHRDVKTSNILLDANFAAKVSDFGLAKVGPIDQIRTHVSTCVKGTFGYMDPCYFYTGKLTRKSDVYAFGVVLFEVLSGRQAVDSTLDEEQWSLAAWAQDQIKEGNLSKIIDSRLMGQISKKCLKEFANIAGHCLHSHPKQRPTMAEVVIKLESILSQERERTNFAVDEGRFIYKLRSFFTGKVDVMSDGVVESIYLMPDNTVGSESDFRALRIQLAKNQRLKHFTYAELVSATSDFKHKEHSHTLNEPIYKVWVDETTYAPTECGVGLEIYVRKKKIDAAKPELDFEEFNHPNLIKLLGYCWHWQEFYCFYELIHGASLDKYLFGDPGTMSLSWVARLKIAVGAAQGLAFLHLRKLAAYTQFKTNCILVDTDFNARLSDYEVENLFATPEWHFYQEYRIDGIPRCEPEDGPGVKSEIYAFGVVLLEILTGMKADDVQRPLTTQNLVKWATPLLVNEVKLRTIMDPQLQRNGYTPKGAFKLAKLVSKCLQKKLDDRPSMEEIVQALCRCYEEEIKLVCAPT